MKPGFVQLMTGAVISVAALTACRKEVPAPLPSPDQSPKPTVRTSHLASAGRSAASAALWLGR